MTKMLRCDGCGCAPTLLADVSNLGLPRWRTIALCWPCASESEWKEVYGALRAIGAEMVDAGGVTFKPPHVVRARYAGNADFSREDRGVLVKDMRESIQMMLPFSSGLALRKVHPTWWNVVHARSGKAVIAGIRWRWQAEKAGKRLIGMLDWRRAEEWLFSEISNSPPLTLALSLLVLRSTSPKLSVRGGRLAHRKRQRKKRKAVNIVKGMTRAEWEQSQSRNLVEGQDDE